MKNPNDDMLDDLFAQARGAKPLPSDDLVARVLADAGAVQLQKPVNTVSQPGLLARFMDMIGGWPAASGLAAATVAGIWVGVAPPASVEEWTANLIGDEINVSAISVDFLFDEGALSDG